MQTSWKLQPCFMPTNPPDPQVDVSEPNGLSTSDTPQSLHDLSSHSDHFLELVEVHPPTQIQIQQLLLFSPDHQPVGPFVMYFNCRSLLPKIDELTVLCITNMPDIVRLVETWSCMDILDTDGDIYSKLFHCQA